MQTDGKIAAGGMEYAIRRLSYDDEPEVQALCERCSDFSMLIEGRKPEKSAGREILSDLPPGKEAKDKFVLGVYGKTGLIAVIDLVRDYKDAGEWMIGLLMIDPDERGNGLGKGLHEFIKTRVSQSKAKALRIGVVEENRRARKFWSEMGYAETDRKKARYGNKEHVVIVMNLPL